MKKVGILTEHRARNFGSCLQAYALQTAINQMGHEANIVDYRPQAIENSFGIFIVDLYKQAGKNPVRLLKFAINTVVFSPLRAMREWKFYKFRKAKFALSKVHFKTLTDDVKNQLDYDAYVCGSDQIWNPKITYGLDEMYFAHPLNGKHMSYAASIGLSDITGYENDFQRLMEGLEPIAVREESAQRLLQPLTEKKVQVVLDPTLLIKKEEWMSLFADRERPKQNYILVYSLKVDDEMVAYARKLGEEKGLPVVFFDLRKRYGKNSISKFTAEPTEFLYYLYHADYVVTNSFHGTVFSTIFEKQFVCVPMHGTSSRMTDLLKKLGLESRLIAEGFDIDATVDFVGAKAILEEEREASWNILKNALE
jgi:hypothetical protein